MVKDLVLPCPAGQAYQALLGFCSTLFLSSPTDELVQQLVDERALFLEEPYCSVAPEAARSLHSLLDETADEGVTSLVQSIRQDYVYLFYLVNVSHTSPFESVYRTDDRTMFGPTTLEVRETYHRWGEAVPEEGRQPDDHIGFELSFVASLLARNDAQATAAASSFLEEHLMTFAPLYLETLMERAQTSFYREVANIARLTLGSLSEALEVPCLSHPA